MLFLSRHESESWSALANEVEAKRLEPEHAISIRPILLPALRYFIATRLTAKGHEALGKRWAVSGVLEEPGGMFANGFLTSFLERQAGRLVMPAVAFEDPRPFVHFAGVPVIQASRQRFIEHGGQSLPRFTHPLRIMDIGCGNGGLLVALLRQLRETEIAADFGEILLIDPSPAMVDLARKTVAEAFPGENVRTVCSRFETFSTEIDGHYDIALSSLAFHHMPIEHKRRHLEALRGSIDHFLLFEVDANHDTPELYSPELALSVYQCYGAIIDFVFSHDADVDLVIACVDCFLMTEAVSILTQPRGVRTDYHMLRPQWHGLFTEALGPAFSCLSDTTCHGDANVNLFGLHYGR